MLEIDPEKRIAAKDILEDHWLKQNYLNYRKEEYTKFIRKLKVEFY